MYVAMRYVLMDAMVSCSIRVQNPCDGGNSCFSSPLLSFYGKGGGWAFVAILMNNVMMALCGI